LIDAGGYIGSAWQDDIGVTVLVQIRKDRAWTVVEMRCQEMAAETFRAGDIGHGEIGLATAKNQNRDTKQEDGESHGETFHFFASIGVGNQNCAP
jgi:hypothetical protein